MPKSIRIPLILALMLLTVLPASGWGYGAYYPQPNVNLTAYPPSSRPAGIYVRKHVSEDNYYLTVYLRNMPPEQLRVDLVRGAIVLHSLRIRQSAGGDRHGGFHTRGYQRFNRRIPLPFDADTQKMSVQREEDRVTVTIPRRKR